MNCIWVNLKNISLTVFKFSVESCYSELSGETKNSLKKQEFETADSKQHRGNDSRTNPRELDLSSNNGVGISWVQLYFNLQKNL